MCYCHKIDIFLDSCYLGFIFFFAQGIFLSDQCSVVSFVLCEICVKQFPGRLALQCSMRRFCSRNQELFCEGQALRFSQCSSRSDLLLLILLSALSSDDLCLCLRLPPCSLSWSCYWKCRASDCKWALRSDSCAGLIRYSIGNAVAVTTLSVWRCLLKTLRLGASPFVSPWETLHSLPAQTEPCSYTRTMIRRKCLSFFTCLSDEIFYTHPPFFLKSKDKTCFHVYFQKRVEHIYLLIKTNMAA